MGPFWDQIRKNVLKLDAVIDAEKTIDNMHFRPEDTKHTNLLEFSNKMFPNIKIVEKTA